jgi:hypothetical protein
VLDKITAFAPDERHYAKVFRSLYASDFTLANNSGWSAGSENILRLVYLPAKIFNSMGISDLNSIRLQAVGYSLSAALMLYSMASNTRFFGLQSRKWITIALLMPSVFLWSTLGLRENLILFFLVGAYFTISKILNSNSKWYLAPLILLLIGLYVTKGYLYIIFFFSVSASVVILYFQRIRDRKKFVIILSSFLIPLLLFPTATKTNFDLGKLFTSVVIESTEQTNLAKLSTVISIVDYESTGQTSQELLFQIKNNLTLYSLVTKFGFYDGLKKASEKVVTKSKEKKSEIRNTKLDFASAKLDDPSSVVIGSLRFLFSPIPFVDSGSYIINLLSYESPVWYIFYLLLLLIVGKLVFRRYETNLTILSVVLFSAFFLVTSALIEVNTGTSIRHRSVLLFLILIAIANVRELSDKNEPEFDDSMQRRDYN